MHHPQIDANERSLAEDSLTRFVLGAAFDQVFGFDDSRVFRSIFHGKISLVESDVIHTTCQDADIDADAAGDKLHTQGLNRRETHRH
jgi:hypothetical protein